MKTISIVIRRDDVFQRVARQMDWEGLRGLRGESDYGRVAINPADRALLHSFFDEAAMNAIDLCRPFLKSVSNSEEALTLTLSLSDDADSALSETLRPAVFNMLAAKVTVMWQEIVIPEKTLSSREKQSEAESSISAILYHHPRPVRLA